MKIFVLDNYDSFTYNLVQLFMRFTSDIEVCRSDMIKVSEVEKKKPNYIIISPGPKDPAYAGISIPLIKELYKKIPILGVCLGMQSMNEAFGGVTIRAPLPVHGKTSIITHNKTRLFKNIPNPFKAARYHSLMVEPAESELEITAKSEEGVIMGLSHPDYPLFGVQFHPESFLTEYGVTLAENFITIGKTQKFLKTSNPREISKLSNKRNYRFCCQQIRTKLDRNRKRKKYCEIAKKRLEADKEWKIEILNSNNPI